MLLGNKCDMEEKRVIAKDKGEMVSALPTTASSTVVTVLLTTAVAAMQILTFSTCLFFPRLTAF